MDFHQEHRGRYSNSYMSTYSSTSSKAQTVSVRSHFYPISSKHAPPKVKFMSSSGGKILPRPSDMKLRYVGGETRMISVHSGINYAEFYLKMTEIYGPYIVLKYQLPEEDLDALVSVSSDEDLENMMEECDKLISSEGSSRLRVFVFQESEIDVIDLNELSDLKSTEQKYIDALNDTSWDLLSSRRNMSFVHAESQSHTFARSYTPWDNGVQSKENGGILHHKSDKDLLTNGFHRDLLTFDHEFHPAPASVTSISQSSTMGVFQGANMHMNESGLTFSVNSSDDFCDLERGASIGSSILSQQLGHLNFSENDDVPNTELQKRLADYNGELHATLGLGKDSQGNDLFVPNYDRTSQHSSDLLVNSDVNAHLNDMSVFAVEGLPANVIQERHQLDAHEATDPFDLLHQGTENTIEVKDAQVQSQAKSAAVFPINSSSSSVHDLDLEAAKNLDLLVKQEEGSITALSSQSSVKSTTKWQVRDQQLQVTNEDKGEVLKASEPEYTSFFTPNEANQTERVYPDFFHKPISQNGLGSAGTAGLSSTEHFFKLETNNDDTNVNSEPVDGYTVQEQSTPYDIVSDDEKIWVHNESMSQKTPNNCAPLASQAGGSTENDFLIKLIDTPPQEAIAKTDLESAIPNSDSFNFLSSVPQITSEEPSFHSIQSSLFSREQFDKTATTFASAFNNEAILRSGQHLQRNPQVGDLGATKVSPLASLIETWEATLLQDDNEQLPVSFQRNAREVIQRIDEDVELELEELDEFKSFDCAPRNVISVAEQEAIARGLQTIRNIDLEELRELGSGTFGTVYHGKWRGTDVAIKRIKASCFFGRQNDRERLMADFWKEACLLSTLHHPNVVAFYGIVPDGPGETLATVTEYMANGSLKQVLRSKERTLDRRKRLLIAMDAAFGMEYLHGKNVVHFDIKCENLLVNLRDIQRPICKVGDLGLSKVKQQTFVSGGVRGTLPWMAPELLNGSSSLVSEKVDVFSFGIVMWELLTGEEPYANMHYGAIIGGIVNNTLRPHIPKFCDPAWRSLMERCWAADPAARPTFLEITRNLRDMEASLASKVSILL